MEQQTSHYQKSHDTKLNAVKKKIMISNSPSKEECDGYAIPVRRFSAALQPEWSTSHHYPGSDVTPIKKEEEEERKVIKKERWFHAHHQKTPFGRLEDNAIDSKSEAFRSDATLPTIQRTRDQVQVKDQE